jgi:hypothetical protein
LDLQKRIHGFEPGKVPLKDSSTGWTILGIKEIDLNGRRGLPNAIRWERKESEENKEINGKEELPHKSPFRLRHIPKALNRGLAIADLLKY